MRINKHVKAAIALFSLMSIITLGTYFSNIAFFAIENYISVEADGSVLVNLFDQLGDSDLTDYSHSKVVRTNLVLCINEMSKGDKFQYYNEIVQPSLSYDWDISNDNFLYDSEQQKTIKQSDDSKGTLVKSVQLSKNTFNLFSVGLAKGNALCDQDFIWSPGKKTMNCLVGYNYSSYLSVGSKLNIIYLNQSIELNIVGILLPNSTILRYNKEMNIDNYIIMPAVNVSYETNNKEDVIFQVALLSQEANGTYKVDGISHIDDFLFFLRDLENKYSIPHALLSNIENRENAINVAMRLSDILGKQVIKYISVFVDIVILVGATLVLLYFRNVVLKGKNHYIIMLFLFCIVSAINILQCISQTYLISGLPYSNAGIMFIASNMILPLIIGYKTKTHDARTTRSV